MTASSLIALAAAGFIASSVGVAFFTRWARHRRLLDVPNVRSSHRAPTPRGAGVVIVIVVVAATMWLSPAWTLSGAVVAFAALVVAMVSAIDDVRSLGSGLRLTVHAACALVAVLAIAGDTEPFTRHPALLGFGLLWLVGITNAYNFMDGIDGISGTQAVVAGVTAGIAAASVGLAAEGTAGIAIAAASAGFLLHNWTPASVFMGDVGSAFLGFAFGVLTLAIGTSSMPLGFAVALSLWPFLFDSALTIVRRATRGENVLQSHRSHLYQRLVIAGWSHSRVALLYGTLAATGGIIGVLWARGMLPAGILVLVPALGAGLWMVVVRQEVAARAGAVQRHDEPAAR